MSILSIAGASIISGTSIVPGMTHEAPSTNTILASFRGNPASGTVYVPTFGHTTPTPGEGSMTTSLLTQDFAPAFRRTATIMMDEARALTRGRKPDARFRDDCHITPGSIGWKENLDGLAYALDKTRVGMFWFLYPPQWFLNPNGTDPMWEKDSLNFLGHDGAYIRLHRALDDAMHLSIGQSPQRLVYLAQQSMRVAASGSVETYGYFFKIRGRFAVGLAAALGVSPPSADEFALGIINFLYGSGQFSDLDELSAPRLDRTEKRISLKRAGKKWTFPKGYAPQDGEVSFRTSETTPRLELWVRASRTAATTPALSLRIVRPADAEPLMPLTQELRAMLWDRPPEQ
jgi:hypothetical protein